MAFINLRLDLSWHKKEAAASTVCLTGFPCRFFWFLLLLIKLGFLADYSVILCEDSSSTLWIRPFFFLCCGFYPLFQGRFVYPDYRRFVSIVLVWIRPLLLIKLGFMAAYSVTLC